MKLNKLNSQLALIANVGVLIGVFLVVYELQQNRLSTESQTRSDISSLTVDSLQRWAESPDIVAAFGKIQDGQDLTRDEEQMMTFVRASELRRWENAYYQFEQGLFTESEFRALSTLWKQRVNGPIYINFWIDQRKEGFSSSFVLFLDSLVDK